MACGGRGVSPLRSETTRRGTQLRRLPRVWRGRRGTRFTALRRRRLPADRRDSGLTPNLVIWSSGYLVIWSLICVLHASQAGLRALVDDGQVALDAVRADHVGMRIARLPPLERRQLGLRSVEDRVIRNDHVGAGRRGNLLEPACRRAVVKQIPVGGRENHPGVEAILKVLRAAGMVGMPVADHDVLDGRG